MEVKKILIVRFSSIGDIVLTTPVVRCIKQQLNNVQVHYVTKEAFKTVLTNNPHIDKLYTFHKDISELYDQLSSESYDVVVDLHKNLRSYRLKQKLSVESHSFNKLNVRKFLAVNLKMIGVLPPKHIVDRYFEAVSGLGVRNDNKGLDYFLSDENKINASGLFFRGKETKYIALVVGGSYYTKKIPLHKLEQICMTAKLPVVLLGGKDDKTIGAELIKKFPHLINTCGEFSINQSASVIQQAEWVITSDTGLMHIASAFDKKIISVWGNTIPEFGMSPYLPRKENKLLQITHLNCRPCSKLGHKKCPKGHFKCMNDIDYSFVADLN